MIICSLDLELNQLKPAKIIEVGWCIGNLVTGEILESGYKFCNPNEPLLEFITNLTSITQADVDSAGTVQEAYEHMLDAMQRHECSKIPLTWGGDDARELRAQCTAVDDKTWAFGHGNPMDLKKIYQFFRASHGMSIQSGLGRSMAKMGLHFQGRKHRAVDDAINTFRFAHFLGEKIRFINPGTNK